MEPRRGGRDRVLDGAVRVDDRRVERAVVAVDRVLHDERKAPLAHLGQIPEKRTDAYGGAFLLMPVAVRLARAAARGLGRLGRATAPRLVLSLFFKVVLGVERI